MKTCSDCGGRLFIIRAGSDENVFACTDCRVTTEIEK